MQIECPSCARSYSISLSALGEAGRSVVCSSCQMRWFVSPDEATANQVRIDSNALNFEKRSTRDGQVAARQIPSFVRVQRAPKRMRAHPGWSLGLVAASVALTMGLIGERVPLIRAVPRLAVAYAAIGLPVNIRGLEIDDVKTVRSDEDGKTSVAISGTIRNIARARTPVPRLTFDIRDGTGATIASWTEGAPKPSLGGSEVVAFTARTASLPAGARDVVVRFADAKDVARRGEGLLVKR